MKSNKGKSTRNFSATNRFPFRSDGVDVTSSWYWYWCWFGIGVSVGVSKSACWKREKERERERHVVDKERKAVKDNPSRWMSEKLTGEILKELTRTYILYIYVDRGVDRHRYLLISTSSGGVCSRRVNSSEWGGSKDGGGDGGGDVGGNGGWERMRLGTSAVSTLLKLQGGKHFRARKRKIGGEDGKENSSLSSIELANTVRAG
ncbi:hypothetical protein V1477_018282 [Vespula maculifrons]|uniref:Uncharacterized protein n=1 Tax=Vespula maculifrons TaxID=7453 RepID=A0ABD2AZ08_VESMC